MYSIQIKNLTKHFGKFAALKNVSLEIPHGRIVGLLGKNGAGKSTLMRCMMGFLQYEGELSIMSHSVKDDRLEILKWMAFIPDVDALDKHLTVKQAINYVSGVNPAWNEKKAEDLLHKSNLPLDKKIGKLSKGMKTKLYLLITLSLDVDILILDEPTLGLDITFRKEFFNTILGEFFDKTKTILISTHQVEEVEHILQDIIFIDKGEVILHESVDKLKEDFNIVTLPKGRQEELELYKPKAISHQIGGVSAILPSDVYIEGAQYDKPNLADLFLAEVGGSDESI